MHKCVRAGHAPAVHTRPSTSRCLVILVSALLEPSSWFSPFYCHFQLYLLRLVTHGSSRQTIPLSTACKTFTGPTNCKCWQEHRRECGGERTKRRDLQWLVNLSIRASIRICEFCFLFLFPFNLKWNNALLLGWGEHEGFSSLWTHCISSKILFHTGENEADKWEVTQKKGFGDVNLCKAMEREKKKLLTFQPHHNPTQ